MTPKSEMSFANGTIRFVKIERFVSQLRNKMSILALGDLHIQPSNLAEINVFLTQLEKHLSQSKYQLIIILGDTLHTHETLHTLCLNKMLEYVQLCEKYSSTYVLVGNHEYVNNAQFLSDLHPYLTWKKDHQIVDRLTKVELFHQDKKYNICMMPYLPDGRFREAVEVSGEKIENFDLFFGHQLFNKVKMGAIVAENVEDWDEKYPLMISGHIHDRQTPFPNLHYTGSSMQVSFGETQDCLLTEYRLETKEIIPINIYPPRKKTIHASLPLDHNVIQLLKPEQNLKFKLILSGHEEEFKTFKQGILYHQLLEQGIRIAYKQKFVQYLPVKAAQKVSFREELSKMIQHDAELVEISRKIFD